MDENTRSLIAAIDRWRSQDIDEYWLSVSYMGPAVNRFGDHDLTFVDGRLWHSWEDGWREIAVGSDFWLFSVPGAFSWARDMLVKVLPGIDGGLESIELAFNEMYGYVEYMRVRMGQRDTQNFTFEVRRFGAGPHPNFEK